MGTFEVRGLGIRIFFEWCRGEGEVSPYALGQEPLLTDGTAEVVGPGSATQPTQRCYSLHDYSEFAIETMYC